MAFATNTRQGNKKEFNNQKPAHPNRNKKWNPNSNRGGNPATHSNNGSNSNAHPSANAQNKTIEVPEDPEMTRLMHDRMLFLLASLTGTVVQVVVKNGTKFEGVFHGASTEGDISVALKHARKTVDPLQNDKSKVNPHPVKDVVFIPGKEIVEIVSPDTDLSAGDGPSHDRESFRTDTDISARAEIKERELHKWNPGQEEGSVFDSLEGDLGASTNGTGSWDQFAANEKLFGLKTDFDEEMYTTRLDRNAPDFKDREKWAIEKANEIQRSAATNIHIMEERGLAVDDSGYDEEDRYGAVVRDGTSNKYMPPAVRKQLQQQSAGKKEAGASKQPAGKLQGVSTSNLPKAGGVTGSPVSHLGRGSPSDKSRDSQMSKRIETEIANTFRQFAKDEKDKLQAKKQALQKKEKESLLQGLMKFHQTFKLNVPVPPDLVPLLSSKKPSSPEEAPAKPAEKKAEEVKTTSPPASKPSVPETSETKPKPSKPSDKTAETKPAAAKPSFKFNVKAMEFKPNPAAPAFVPGGKPASSSAETSPFFTGRQLKKGNVNERITVADAFSSPFAKQNNKRANSVGPTWPFGTKQYRHHFHQYSPYEEDMYQGYASPGYPYGYPQYRYPPNMSPMAVQQPGHVPYMSPQFVHNVPMTAAPMPHAGAPPAVAYSPQMANVSPHGSPFPQGFPSPQRSPIVPQGAPPHQVYQYQGNAPHEGPMMIRYPPEGMPPNVTAGPGPVMMQRPVMVEPLPYQPQADQSPATEPPVDTPTSH